VVRSAHRGCYVIDCRRLESEIAKGFKNWSLSEKVRVFDPEEYGTSGIPDLSLDPNDHILTALNPYEKERAFHISVREPVELFGCEVLSEKQDGVTTLVLALPARSVFDICTFFGDPQLLSSEVVDIVPPVTHMQVNYPFTFPLGTHCSEKTFLCTQAENGGLSHFVHAGTYYALDFRCPLKTPVLAVADATVFNIVSSGSKNSIHVDAFFHYNAITLKILHKQGEMFVEYVHLHTICVEIGQSVRAGDIIGLSGAAGFCPEPHLHIQLHQESRPDAPSIPMRFVLSNNSNTDDDTENNNNHERIFPQVGQRWPGVLLPLE